MDALERFDFENDGFCGPLSLVPQDLAERALEEVRGETNRFKLHLFLPYVAAIARHPAVVSAVQRALGSDHVLLWSSDVNTKPPDSPGFFAPHQDSTYAGLDPPGRCVTVWVALSDPVGDKEGCLSFYRGSQSLGQVDHTSKSSRKDKAETRGNNEHNMLVFGQFVSDESLLSRFQRVSVPLRAGQATIHNFLTIHQSGPNRSGTDRVGLALRYVESCVSQTKPVQECVTLISGEAPDHFDLEPLLPTHRPSKEDVERGRSARDESMRREQINYFQHAK